MIRATAGEDRESRANQGDEGVTTEDLSATRTSATEDPPSEALDARSAPGALRMNFAPEKSFTRRGRGHRVSALAKTQLEISISSLWRIAPVAHTIPANLGRHLSEATTRLKSRGTVARKRRR